MGISSRIVLISLGIVALAATTACGSSSGGTGGDSSMGTGGQTSMGTGGAGTGGAASTSTSSTTSSSSSTTTSSSSSGTGGGMGTGGGSSCQGDCINNNPAAAQKFEGYELKECGCQTGAPCASQCTAECANPATLMQSSPCGMCLLAEAGKGQSSACTTKAGLQDCLPDSMCAPFVQCVIGCP